MGKLTALGCLGLQPKSGVLGLIRPHANLHDILNPRISHEVHAKTNEHVLSMVRRISPSVCTKFLFSRCLNFMACHEAGHEWPKLQGESFKLEWLNM